MDRPLDSQFRKTRFIRRIALTAAVLIVLAIPFIWGPGWMSPTISRGRIRTARVDVGPIDALITASGTVMPEIEEAISSPLDTRVVRILARAGAVLSPRQPLVELDSTEARLTLDRSTRNLALKQNEQAKTKLELERRLNDLDSQASVKRLQLQSYQSQLTRNQQLFKEGLLSIEQLTQSELAERQAGIELKKIENERQNAGQSNAALVEGLADDRKHESGVRSSTARELT